MREHGVLDRVLQGIVKYGGPLSPTGTNSYIVLTRRRADLVQSNGVDRHVELVALQWL